MMYNDSYQNFRILYKKNTELKMKRSAFALFFLLFSIFVYAENPEKEDENQQLFYVISADELHHFSQCWNWLQKWEEGEIKISDEEFARVYENQTGKNLFSAMLYEIFFINSKNKDIQKQVKKYIQKNKLEEKPFEKALLKKYSSKKQTMKQGDKKVIQYSYKDLEFDENINLSDFFEVHPFNDEFGFMLFNNDWNVMAMHSMKTKQPLDDKKLIYIIGGGTNSMKITVEEFEDVSVNDAEDIIRIAKLDNISQKYADDWFFAEPEKNGILENCGVDNYYVGYGIGSDYFFPEISCADFVTCMYKKSTGKVYKMHIYMNYSKININYEIRDRIYSYVKFFTLFCYCD